MPSKDSQALKSDRLPAQSGWKTWLPVLGFWQGRETLVADILAGLTVGLVLVPQAMAYADLAGMEAQYGLYASTFACIAGAIFGRCAQLQTGPVAMTSLIAFATVSSLNPTPAQYISLMAILAILVGVLRIALGLLRGAALAAVISRPVLVGFGSAAGIIIASTQVPKLFFVGHEAAYSNPVVESLYVFGHLGDVHLPTLLMGAGTLTAMILLKKFAPRLPGLLLAMAAAGVVSWLIDFETMGGNIVGAIPPGLPELSIPTVGWASAGDLLGGAMLVVLIGLLEVMTVTGAAEQRYGTRPDLNGELVGQGAASLVAGVSSGFPVSGSLSRSSLNMIAGARTGLSSVVAASVVILTLMFLTPLLAPLPNPALAAAVVMAVAALVRPLDLIAVWKVRRSDAIFGAITMMVTLAVAPDMVYGMACGVGLNLAYSTWRSMRPRCVIVAQDGTGRLKAVAHQHIPAEHCQGGRLIIRIDSRVHYLNARLLGEKIRRWLDGCPEKTEIVLYACGINDIDSTGVDMIADLKEHTDKGGQTLAIADVKAKVDLRIHEHPTLTELPVLAQPDDPLPKPT